MKRMKTTVWLLAVSTVLLLVGTFVSIFTQETWIYTTPPFLAAAAALLAVQAACLIRRRPSWKQLGFYLCHIGFLVVGVGAIASMLLRQETRFAIPVDPYAAYGSVQNLDGTEVRFGFDLTCTGFSVERYDPDYRLYQEDPSAETGYSVVLETVIQSRDGLYRLGDWADPVPADRLYRDGAWLEQLDLGGGLVLVRIPPADKSYQADLLIHEENGDTLPMTLRVNDPHTHAGWKFYLMDYDKEAGQYVSLLAKHDPANQPILAGLWLIMVGTPLMCWRPRKEKEV